MRLEIETARGIAWADVDEAGGTSRGENLSPPRGNETRALLLLGHGAGGSVDAPDLLAARDAALAVGVSVARVTLPYRVAGRRGMPPHPTLEQPWLDVATVLAARYPALPQIFGGRSAGARVACRTAEVGDAVAVICLAYPVHPPGKPEVSRMDELDAVRVPVLVIQGDHDAFGMPPPRRRGRTLIVAEGADHSLKKGLGDVHRGVTRFLRRVL